MTSFRHFSNFLIILMLLFFLTETNYLHSQSQITVVKIRQTYAIINKGTLDGIKVGDHFTVQTPNRPSQYGEVEVIKESETISAVKLIFGIAGYNLKVGDIGAVSTNLSPEQLLNEAVNLADVLQNPKLRIDKRLLIMMNLTPLLKRRIMVNPLILTTLLGEVRF